MRAFNKRIEPMTGSGSGPVLQSGVTGPPLVTAHPFRSALRC